MSRVSLRLVAPGRGLAATAVLAVMCAISLPSAVMAQPKKGKPAAAAGSTDGAKATDKKAAGNKEKNFDFNNLQLNGQLRTPQLLYFLERANEELERASLEKRSFIPHMVRSLEEEAL